MNKRQALVTMLVTLGLAVPLAAAEPNKAALSELESAKRNIARAAESSEGNTRAALFREVQRIDAMIEALEAGDTIQYKSPASTGGSVR